MDNSFRKLDALTVIIKVSHLLLLTVFHAQFLHLIRLLTLNFIMKAINGVPK